MHKTIVKPRVSVGLPVYNGELYIEETIKSILAQTFVDFELIITDNASDDNTPKICQSYAAQDSRIHYHRNEENLGAAPNYNKAFQLASGGYFKWAAYDDLIAPEFLSMCVEVLDQYPNVVLCYSRTTLIEEKDIFIHDYSPEPNTRLQQPHERFGSLILTDTIWAGVLSFGLIRSDAIRQTSKIGGYPGSDEVFVAELALKGSFYEIPECLFQMRIHPDQSTRGILAAERDRIIWFDTSLEGKIVLPKWRYFFGCLRAIREAPISRYERLNSFVQMGRWLLDLHHIRAMGKDVLLAVRIIILYSVQHLLRNN